MSFLKEKTNIRTVRQDDPLFRIQSGAVLAQRAGFEIDSTCPKEYTLMIHQAIEYGWIKPVAFMTDQEYFLTALGKE